MTFVTMGENGLEPRDALRRVLFLKSLPDTVLTTLVERGGVRRLVRGEMLFAEHDRCLGLIVVLRGAIKVYKLDSRGREMTLDREGPGESVLEMPLFDGGNYPASAEAVEDMTTVFLVPRAAFQSASAIHPEIAEQALLALGVRMRKLLWMLEAQTLHPVRARLADYLLRIAEGRDTFRLDETNEAIAGRIGTVREVVSRTLRSFKDAGAIDLRGRWVTLLDPDALRQTGRAEQNA